MVVPSIAGVAAQAFVEAGARGEEGRGRCDGEGLLDLDEGAFFRELKGVLGLERNDAVSEGSSFFSDPGSSDTNSDGAVQLAILCVGWPFVTIICSNPCPFSAHHAADLAPFYCCSRMKAPAYCGTLVGPRWCNRASGSLFTYWF